MWFMYPGSIALVGCQTARSPEYAVVIRACVKDLHPVAIRKIEKSQKHPLERDKPRILSGSRLWYRRQMEIATCWI
jgi:hypothetical protein